MHVTFPPSAPGYRGWNLTVGFAAWANGKDIDCAISAEALQDHFGAASPDASDLLGAVNQHRDEIERVARNLLHTLHTGQLLLHSGHFRFALDDRAGGES